MWNTCKLGNGRVLRYDSTCTLKFMYEIYRKLHNILFTSCSCPVVVNTVPLAFSSPLLLSDLEPHSSWLCPSFFRLPPLFCQEYGRLGFKWLLSHWWWWLLLVSWWHLHEERSLRSSWKVNLLYTEIRFTVVWLAMSPSTQAMSLFWAFL